MRMNLSQAHISVTRVPSSRPQSWQTRLQLAIDWTRYTVFSLSPCCWQAARVHGECLVVSLYTRRRQTRLSIRSRGVRHVTEGYQAREAVQREAHDTYYNLNRAEHTSVCMLISDTTRLVMAGDMRRTQTLARIRHSIRIIQGLASLSLTPER